MFGSLFENLCSWKDEQWQLYTDNAEYEAWLDSQEKSYPLPEDFDPNYENDFEDDPTLLAIATFDLPIAA